MQQLKMDDKEGKQLPPDLSEIRLLLTEQSQERDKLQAHLDLIMKKIEAKEKNSQERLDALEKKCSDIET